MKYLVAFVFLAIVVVAHCQDAEDEPVKGKWTKEQVLDKINSKLPVDNGICINPRCKMSCVAEGHKAGYCVANTCTCIV